MRAFRSLWSVGLCCALVLAAGGLFVSDATAALTIQLRLPGNPAGGGVVEPTGPGQTINMEIWAVVTDSNDADATDSGVWKFYSSFRSSNGGVMLGNLTDAWFPTYPATLWGDPAVGSDELANLGTASDLDDDGDNDIGSNDPGAPGPPWFLVRHSVGMQFQDAPFDLPSPMPPREYTNEWPIATLQFVATAWGDDYDPDGQSGVTEIWAEPRQHGAANWMEDGVTKVNWWDPAPGDPNAGDIVSGDKVVLGIPSTAHGPDGGPEGFKVGPTDAPLTLDGSASTGSINWWAWDFDGDGDYDLEGDVAFPLGVDYNWLKGLDDATVTEGEEWPDGGTKTATMTVGWSASDPVNTSTTTFGLTLVPEPATVALLAVGLVTLIRRRK